MMQGKGKAKTIKISLNCLSGFICIKMFIPFLDKSNRIFTHDQYDDDALSCKPIIFMLMTCKLLYFGVFLCTFEIGKTHTPS